VALHYYYSIFNSNTEIDLGHMNQSWRQSTSYLSKSIEGSRNKSRLQCCGPTQQIHVMSPTCTRI